MKSSLASIPLPIIPLALRFYRALRCGAGSSAGLEARLYVSQDGRRYGLQTGFQAATRTLRDSGVGSAARFTAAAVSASGKVCVSKGRTSSWRENTSRATSA